MQSLTLEEHIQLTLVSEGARPGWLVDSRWKYDTKEFLKMIKGYKNKEGIKIYKNIDLNTNDKRFTITYNKLLTKPNEPKNSSHYEDKEIGKMIGYPYVIDLEDQDEEKYTVHIVAVSKKSDESMSSLNSIPPIFLNRSDFSDINIDENVIINITSTIVPKNFDIEIFNDMIRRFEAAIIASNNEIVKDSLISKNFFRLVIQKSYSSSYLIKKLLSQDILTSDEEKSIKYHLFLNTDWLKAYYYDFDFNNRIQRFLIVNILNITDSLNQDYEKIKSLEQDFLNLIKISSI
jgi:hypothetical protein